MHNVASSHLVRMTKKYPAAWKQGQLLRQGKGQGLPDWPDWCFMPMAGWYAVLLETPPFAIHDLAPLAALGAWRYTQGIYRFDGELLQALGDTVITGDLPTEVLFCLPEWCVFAETPGMSWQGRPLDGFFAYLEWDGKAERAELRFVFALQGEERLIAAIAVHLGPWPLAEALEKAVKVAQEQAIKSKIDMSGLPEAVADCSGDLHSLISLLLYICSDEPDIQGHQTGDYPRYAKPKKVHGDWMLFPPPKPKIWRVGEELGKALRTASAQAKQTVKSDNSGKRPHIRRGHWHGFWSGPKTDKASGNQRKYSCKWLPPTLVKGHFEE